MKTLLVNLKVTVTGHLTNEELEERFLELTEEVESVIAVNSIKVEAIN